MRHLLRQSKKHILIGCFQFLCRFLILRILQNGFPILYWNYQNQIYNLYLLAIFAISIRTLFAIESIQMHKFLYKNLPNNWLWSCYANCFSEKRWQNYTETHNARGVRNACFTLWNLLRPYPVYQLLFFCLSVRNVRSLLFQKLRARYISR